MTRRFSKTLPVFLAFLIGMVAGLCLNASRVEAGLFDKFNFKVVDDLKSMGKSIKQMDRDVKDLQKNMDSVRETRESIAKRLGVSDLLKDKDEKE